MKPVARREFLSKSAALLGAVGVGGLAAAEDTRAADQPTAPADQPTTPANPAAADVAAVGYGATQAELASRVPFVGLHQSGILTPAPAQATLMALDSFAPDRATLIATLKALSQRAGQLTVGGPAPVLEGDAPPADSGILGPVNAPDDLTVTIAFGASLFDDR
jgi:deferrochelatase/peroxidase EfeB